MREVHQDTPKPTLRKGGSTPRTDNWLTTESSKAYENDGDSCPSPQPLHMEKANYPWPQDLNLKGALPTAHAGGKNTETGL